MPQFDWPPKPLPNPTAALRDATSRKASFRRNAAISLGRVPDDLKTQAIEALEKLLEDDDRTVRIEAVCSLAALDASDLTDRISHLLSSDDPDQRAAALEFMAATGSGDHAPILSIIEKDPDAVVRCVALETLATLDPAKAAAASRAIIEGRDPQVPVVRTALVILRELRRDDAELIAALLDDPRRGVSLEAAATLAHLEDPRGIPRLMTEARSPSSSDERTVALEALCRTSDASVHDLARKRLSGLLTSREEKIHWAGILASTGDAPALDAIRNRIDGRDPHKAAAAMRVAGLCSLTSLVSRLSEIARAGLSGDETALSAESIEALGLMRCTAAATALRSLVDMSEGPAADHPRAALEEVERWTRS